MQKAALGKGSKVWDCCAASGGKSLLVKDLFPEIALTVSDVRSSILHNLEERFKKAGIKDYHSFVADLTKPKSIPFAEQRFDLIICDAPCSGAGTWSRTPEQLHYTQQADIERYSQLQKSIVTNAVTQVKKGGYFLYITCSVFSRENEEVTALIESNTALHLVEEKYLTGYEKKADTLYAALFQL